MTKVMIETVAYRSEAKTAIVRETSDRFINTLTEFAPLIEYPKKTSIRTVNGSPLAGAPTRKDSILLNIRTAHQINFLVFTEAICFHLKRFRNELNFKFPKDFGDELIGRLKCTYELTE